MKLTDLKDLRVIKKELTPEPSRLRFFFANK